MRLLEDFKNSLTNKSAFKSDYDLGKKGLILILGYKKTLYEDYLLATKKVDDEISRMLFLELLSKDKVKSKYFPTLGRYTLYDVTTCATWLLRSNFYLNHFIEKKVDFIPTMMYNKFLDKTKYKTRTHVQNNNVEWDFEDRKVMTYEQFINKISSNESFMEENGCVFENNVNIQLKSVISQIKNKTKNNAEIKLNFLDEKPFDIFNATINFLSRKTKSGKQKLDLYVQIPRIEGSSHLPFAISLYSIILKVVSDECELLLGRIYFNVSEVFHNQLLDNCEFGMIDFEINSSKLNTPVFDRNKQLMFL